MRATLAIIALFSAQAAAPPAPCCAYGGTGSTSLFGTGIFNGTMIGMVIGTSSSGVAVLVNSTDPDSAAFGWFVTGDQKSQTLHAYAPSTAGSAKICSVTQVPAYALLPGFAMCAGSSKSLFPVFGASYGIGGSAVQVNAYIQPPSGSRASFLPAAANCAPVSILSVWNPFGGAWSIDFEDGASVTPPARYFAMPKYCQ